MNSRDLAASHQTRRQGKTYGVQLLSDRESPAWQIIEYLKRKGSATIKELEDVFGVTTTAVRQHLQHSRRTAISSANGSMPGWDDPTAYSITGKVHELFACHCETWR